MSSQQSCPWSDSLTRLPARHPACLPFPATGSPVHFTAKQTVVRPTTSLLLTGHERQEYTTSSPVKPHDYATDVPPLEHDQSMIVTLLEHIVTIVVKPYLDKLCVLLGLHPYTTSRPTLGEGYL